MDAHLKPRAISGSLVDARNVATHKSFRLVIDIPAEEAMTAIEAFGWPTMAAPVPVAVARLAVAPEIEATAEVVPISGKRTWRELSYAQQAGIRCNEPAFWKYLTEVGEADVGDADKAANYVRLICKVHSRADFDKYPWAKAEWLHLERKYQTWLAVVV